MNRYVQQGKVLARKLIRTLVKFGLFLRQFLLKQFNKNIYTRILFMNVLCFVICFVALITAFDFTVKQVTYNQIQQDTLRKAKRVNFALLQQNNLKWLGAFADEQNNGTYNQQEVLTSLSDVFNAKITVFDREGNIVTTSAKQDIVPGSQVEKNFIKIISTGEIITARIIDNETGELVFIAAIPMGDSKDTIENGILLEMKSPKIDPDINKMRLYLITGGIFILLMVIFISVYQAMHISKPISRLATSIAGLDSKNYVIQEDEPALDEIKTLTSQLNKLNEKMQKIQEENQKGEEERTRLFAEISHELRTPLTSVQGFVEAIQDGIVQDKDLLDRYLEIIYTQTMHINRLVDDILQLSRLESGSISLEKTPLDLVTLTQGVVVSIGAMAQARNTSVLFEKNTERAMILGDIDRIEQVIRNLLQNAISATKDGEITVRVEILQHEVILTIKDNGIGISSEELPRIWDRFYRSKNQRGNGKLQQSSGLGLVIVKQLVKLHHGKIDVESQLGKGTVFYVRFPAAHTNS
ncbi:sensor histidine kinase [Geosporobacter ferrireducens]|uniref:histidine kinase n=1 Tax=Geosporobacter ferrireducens TaxID=1424294 RepID=A0A1D8GLY0_9FIRM|nr:HAMP domain-containing sensor histidine kinase [Geosporobacter ferrireducens]AOT71927.1 two-component sensor histidine kinase [Geosporobacter ferrireducens]MTI55716.1 HAMP domain-containing histidine kinase [Geosporobacter ferrireducens]